MKQFSADQSQEIAGKRYIRDLIIAHIIGLQNDRYWNVESEGYKALQDLLLLIEDRYGEFMKDFKG